MTSIPQAGKDQPGQKESDGQGERNSGYESNALEGVNSPGRKQALSVFFLLLTQEKKHFE